MHFTEVAELEDKVSLLRSERMLTVAAAELSNPSGSLGTLDGSESLGRSSGKAMLNRKHSSRYPSSNSALGDQHGGGLFGSDPVVARLFASSPPERTFTLEEDDDLREDNDQVVSFPTKNSESRRKVLMRGAASGVDTNDHGLTTKINFEVAHVNEDDDDETLELDNIPSGISFALGGDQDPYGDAMRGRKRGGVNAGSGSTVGRKIMIYLPDRTPMDVTVPTNSKVSDVIQMLLDRDRRAGGGRNLKLYPDASKYELRIHEEDGLPDLDFPACDGDMDIENLCDGLEPEFCICAKAGEDVDLGNLPAEAEDEFDVEGAHGTSFERLNQVLKEQSATLVKISLPENGFQTSIKCTPGMTAVDLLRIIQTKQRLPLFTEEYLFTVSEEERQELGLMSRKIEMKTDIYAANIRHLELSRRKYADAPSQQDTSTDRMEPDYRHRDRGSSAAIHEDGVEPVNIKRTTQPNRFNPDNVLFNDQMAALYEEWDVIKTNKWGKRQRRVLGVDHQKVYNKKQEKDLGKNMLSKDTVKRAERDIAEIRSFQVCADDPNCIEIRWKVPKDSNSNSTNTSKDDLSLKYEIAKGPEAAAYIVAKLQYLSKNRR